MKPRYKLIRFVRSGCPGSLPLGLPRHGVTEIAAPRGVYLARKVSAFEVIARGFASMPPLGRL